MKSQTIFATAYNCIVDFSKLATAFYLDGQKVKLTGKYFFYEEDMMTYTEFEAEHPLSGLIRISELDIIQ